MPQIRFRPVGQSALGGQTAALLQSGTSDITGAGERFTDILEQRQQREQDNVGKLRDFNTTEIANYFKSFKTPEDLAAARASGEIQETIGQYGGAYDHDVVGSLFDNTLKTARERVIAQNTYALNRQSAADRPLIDNYTARFGAIDRSSIDSINTGVADIMADVQNDPNLSAAGKAAVQAQGLKLESAFKIDTDRDNARTRRTRLEGEADLLTTQNKAVRAIVNRVSDVATDETDALARFRAESEGLTTQQIIDGTSLIAGRFGALSTLSKEQQVIANAQNEIATRNYQNKATQLERIRDHFSPEQLALSPGKAKADALSELGGDTDSNRTFLNTYSTEAQNEIKLLHGDTLPASIPWGAIIYEAALDVGNTQAAGIAGDLELRDPAAFKRAMLEGYNKYIASLDAVNRLADLNDNYIAGALDREGYDSSSLTDNATEVQDERAVAAAVERATQNRNRGPAFEGSGVGAPATSFNQEPALAPAPPSAALSIPAPTREEPVQTQSSLEQRKADLRAQGFNPPPSLSEVGEVIRGTIAEIPRVLGAPRGPTPTLFGPNSILAQQARENEFPVPSSPEESNNALRLRIQKALAARNDQQTSTPEPSQPVPTPVATPPSYAEEIEAFDRDIASGAESRVQAAITGNGGAIKDIAEVIVNTRVAEVEEAKANASPFARALGVARGAPEFVYSQPKAEAVGRLLEHYVKNILTAQERRDFFFGPNTNALVKEAVTAFEQQVDQQSK